MVTNSWSAGDRIPSVSGLQTGSAVTALTPLPMRAGHLPVSQIISLYLAHYSGRDTTRIQRLTWWAGAIGGVILEEVADDHVHAALEALAQQSATYYAGKDANGQAILKAKRKPLSPATLNRYNAALAAVFTWAIKRRIAPKGWIHPCRSVERRAENNEQTRYLTDDERSRLLDACRQSRWPGLYLLVLMGLTTGARKGELLGLRWDHVDLERSVAFVGRSKNGDPKALPLVPAVAELLRLAPKQSGPVFPSPRLPSQPINPEAPWRDALRAAKVRKFRFHDLRHSCASMLAQNGATLLEIADLLGHRQLQVTKRYAHLATAHKAALVQRVLGDIR